ncbi:MAG: sigma factor-like helix-turn-helix DNA-binding protein [Bacillota bacterium]
MLKMIYEYKMALRDARKMHTKLDCDDLSTQEKIDKAIISSMITDLEFVIKWLETGRNPDLRRGNDKKGIYSINPQTLDRIKIQKFDNEFRELTEDERGMIEDAICDLTKREKDAYFMVKVEGLSYKCAAELMGIKKTTLQNHVGRAKKKIEIRKNSSLFLIS